MGEQMDTHEVIRSLTDVLKLQGRSLMSALGGSPSFEVASVEVSSSSAKALAQLLDNEREAVAALHEVISHSGQEPHSEALEHLLEHVIMRKQRQVDFLVHAIRAD